VPAGDWEVTKPELFAEGEAIAAYGAATMKILVVYLLANGALEHG
jgi:hypothetical protein